ncbi:hypothetical protein [Intestinimonas butyriciproducens]|uniref:PBECR3 domain-containing polyvalent protein n=1 Tax=Intestinimonas butyriciproducens TaxID=1297617 RepID=UPI0031B5FEE1
MGTLRKIGAQTAPKSFQTEKRAVQPPTRVDTPITQAARAGLQTGTLPISGKAVDTFLTPRSTLSDTDELWAETLHRNNPAVSLPAQAKSVLRDVDGVTSLPTGAEHVREHASGQIAERVRGELAALDRKYSAWDVAPYSEEERKADQDRREALEDQLYRAREGAYEEGDRSFGQRLNYGAASIAQTAGAALPLLWDTARQYISNNEQQSSDPRRAELAGQIAELGGQLDYLERYKYPTRYAARQSEEWKTLDAERTKLREELAALDANTPVSMDAPGMQRMTEAIETREKALSGTEGVPRFLGETAISIGQNLALMPTAAISPAVPLAAMGAIAAADKTYELNSRGVAPGEALARGLVSGGIEAATEKIPLDSLLDLVKTGGRSAVRSLLRQMGTEATEESVSYFLNYVADKAAKDPEAKFSFQELAEAAAGGALSGGVLGGGALLVNKTMGAGNSGMQSAVEGLPDRLREETAFVSLPDGLRKDRAIELLPDFKAAGVAVEAAGTANTQTMGLDTPAPQRAQKTASTGETGYNRIEADSIRHEGKNFRNLVAGIDSSVSAFFEKWRNGRKGRPDEKLEKLYLGRMSEGTRAAVSDILGYEVSERDFIVTNDGVKHILDTHGDPEAEVRKGNLPLTSDIIDALPSVVKNPDNIRPGHAEKSSPYRQGVIFEKMLPDGTVVYIQFDNSKRGTFEGRTLYVKEKESSPSGVDASMETPTSTSKTTEPELSSTPIIADSSAGGNTQSAPNAGGVSGVAYPKTMTVNGREYTVYQELPEGWAVNDRAMTAPNGYLFIHNNKSLLGGERKTALMPDKWLQDEMARERGIDSPLPSQTGPESSVGAAQMGFDPYSNLQNQKSEFHKDGEKATRQVDVPTTDLNDQRIPKSAATVMESGNITDEAVMEVQRQVADGTLSFTRNTDKGAMAKSEQTVRELGWDGAVERFHQEARRGVVSKDNMALGATLLVNSAQNGDIKTFASLLIDYTSMSRAGAQATQANRLLKKLSPEGQLYGVQRSIGNLQEELNRRYGDDKAPQIAVDPELMAEFTASADQAGRDAAMKRIWQNVADQVPATWKDKWDAWRYLSMLGNPRTHIRNIAGNAAFMPVRLAKDAVAWAGEGIADKMLPGGIKRTKSPLNLASESDRALLRAAFQDAAGQRESILGQGKFNDDPMGQIRDRQTVFGVKPLETVRKANSKALDVEDAWFSTPAYAGALAGYLKANHATLETASPSLLDDARAYAVREAQRSTYRDSNALSDFVAGLRYRGKNPVGQGANLLMEGILPFRRTPANILTRGVEYSPVGLVKGLTYDLTQVRNGKLSAAEAIDNIAAGLTGTGLLALGAFMAAQGWVTGGSGDDEQAELDNLTGEQPYAVTIGSHSYTLDWMAPEALPFFVGVELYNNLADNGTRSGRAMNDITSSLSSLTEPMLEMSMLQGLQDAIDSVAYSENKLAGLIASSVTGYLSQGLPTIFGQAERTREDRRETTFVDRTSPLSNDLQRGLGRTMNKLPGDFQQIPYIDGWGRTESSGKLLPRAAENFLAPWYSSQKNVTEADRELQRLLDAGQSGVVAKRTPQNIQVTYKENPEDETNQKRYLNAEEYVTYATVKGQTSYDLVMDMINSAEYRSMTDEQKADAIKLAYTYAGHLAAEEVTGGKHESEEYVDLAQAAKKELGLYEAEYLLLCEKYGKGVMNGDGIREAYQNGIALDDYLTYAGALKAVKADKEAKTGKKPGSTSQVDSARALLRDSSLTDKERAVLWSLEGGKDDEGKAKWNESSNPFGGRCTAIRERFGLDMDTFLDALEIYHGKGKAADKKAALRALIGPQGNALYDQLGKR